MKIKDLLNNWNQSDKRTSQKEFNIQLSAKDAARVLALADMYPNNQPDKILSDIISAALRELESSFPYVKGDKITGMDEMGDPFYEDEGPTPTFLELTKKHYEMLNQP